MEGKLFRIVHSELGQVEAALRDFVSGRDDLIPAVYRHSLDAGGKRLRPALTLLAGRALGCRNERLVRLAAAPELVHLASLIHDDVVDEADIRRGRPAANAAFDNKTSVLVADFLVAKVYADLAQRRELHALAALATAVNHMCEGELRHLEARQTLGRLDEASYYDVVRKKTGSLMGACCDIGATAAHGPSEHVAALTQYGVELGTAFQIADDLLDLVGDPDELGKPVGNDLAMGKLTLPVIYALETSEDGLPAHLERVVGRGPLTREELHAVVALVEQTGGIGYARQAAERFAERARARLAPLPSSDAKTALLDLPDYCVRRTH